MVLYGSLVVITVCVCVWLLFNACALCVVYYVMLSVFVGVLLCCVCLFVVSYVLLCGMCLNVFVCFVCDISWLCV